LEVTNHQLRFNKYSFGNVWKYGFQGAVNKRTQLSSSEMGFHFPSAYSGDSGHLFPSIPATPSEKRGQIFIFDNKQHRKVLTSNFSVGYVA